MFIIDRFEGEWAVIERDDRTTFNLPRSLLPITAREGDVIFIQVTVDREATKAKRGKMQRLLKFDK